MTPKSDEVVVFDTEFTAWAGSVARGWRGPSEFKEIVQIGAVIVNTATLKEQSAFSVLIHPVKNPVLSDYFVKLTRITNQRLRDDGVAFSEGIARYLQFSQHRTSYCYGRDDKIIAENAALLGLGDQWPSKPSINLRYWLEKVGVPLTGIHAGELSAHVGAASQGIAHDALTDARSLAEAVRYLIGKGGPNPFMS